VADCKAASKAAGKPAEGAELSEEARRSAKQAAQAAMDSCLKAAGFDPATLPTKGPKAGAPGQSKPKGPKAEKITGGVGIDDAVHGEIIVKTPSGTFETVTFDRGEVRSVTGNTLVVHREDGPDVRVTLADTTKYLGLAGKDALVGGMQVHVISKDGTARVVATKPARGEGKKPDRPGANKRGGGQPAQPGGPAPASLRTA
jgi:hypothetical protein